LVWEFREIAVPSGSATLALARTSASNAEAVQAACERSALLRQTKAELQLPLKQIVDVSGILRSGALAADDPRYESYLDRLHETALRLLANLRDTLDAVDVSSFRLDEATVHLVGTVMRAVRRAEREPDTKGRIIVDLPPALPTVRIDEEKFERAMLAVIAHVARVTPRRARVSISAAVRRDGGVVLRVAGMAERPVEPAETGSVRPAVPAAPRAATEVWTVDPSMAVAAEFVRLHGGEIVFARPDGGDRTAELWLPRERTVHAI
jgi:K+-sensing histidine kinase KdpD